MSAPRPVKDRTIGRHVGFGKVILFGEHVVVHGAPAIVAGISEYTDCQLRLLRGKPGFHVVDNRPAVPGYIVEKRAEQKVAHDLVLKHLKIDLSTDGLEATIGGPLVPSSGIGASASDVVSLSRALSELYNLGLSEHEVNNSAFVGEGGYHGTTSGVDNTAATFGGLLIYRRTAKGPEFARLPTKATLFLVVISTGITASTTKVVGDVRKLKESKPEWFAGIMKEYQALYEGANDAVRLGDVPRLGKLMNAAHDVMQRLTVSCVELDSIVTVARDAGAIWAKMSGTGRGGIAVALCDSAASQAAVASALESKCPAAKFVWKYSVLPQASAKL